MLHTLTAPPPHISPESHAQLTSSTPTSFQSIPPILRWEDEVEVELIPSTGWDWEGRKGGRMWVTEELVAFLPSPLDPSGQSQAPGFSLPYTALTLHALVPPQEDRPGHLYCQVDESDAPKGFNIVESGGGMNGHGANGNGNGDVNVEDEEEEDGEGDNGAEEEFAEMREVRIYLPETKLQSLFSALSQCSALHASLLPSGEPSSFFGFATEHDDIDDGDGEYDEEDGAEEEQGEGEGGDQEGGEGGDGGRVRSDFHSGGGPQARFRPY